MNVGKRLSYDQLITTEEQTSFDNLLLYLVHEIVIQFTSVEKRYIKSWI